MQEFLNNSQEKLLRSNSKEELVAAPQQEKIELKNVEKVAAANVDGCEDYFVSTSTNHQMDQINDQDSISPQQYDTRL